VRNAGFIRQKSALDAVQPDKSGVPGAAPLAFPIDALVSQCRNRYL